MSPCLDLYTEGPMIERWRGRQVSGLVMVPRIHEHYCLEHDHRWRCTDSRPLNALCRLGDVAVCPGDGEYPPTDGCLMP